MSGGGGDRPVGLQTSPFRIPAEQLIKEDFPKSSDDAPVISFAQKVEETIDYKIPNRIRFEEGKAPTLLELFQQHGVQLYRPSDTRVYKAQKAKQVRKEVNRRRVIMNVVVSVLATFGLVALTTFWLSKTPTDEFGNLTETGAALVMVSFFSVVGYVLWLMSLLMGGWKKKVSWTTYYRFTGGYGSYEGIIPESTLKLMVSIKELIPEVVFQIDALEVDSSTIYDPIVFAYLEEEPEFEAPIAIWDQPGYHSKLIDSVNGGKI